MALISTTVAVRWISGGLGVAVVGVMTFMGNSIYQNDKTNVEAHTDIRTEHKEDIIRIQSRVEDKLDNLQMEQRAIYIDIRDRIDAIPR